LFLSIFFFLFSGFLRLLSYLISILSSANGSEGREMRIGDWGLGIKTSSYVVLR
jgi:hypothetical protein